MVCSESGGHKHGGCYRGDEGRKLCWKFATRPFLGRERTAVDVDVCPGEGWVLLKIPRGDIPCRKWELTCLPPWVAKERMGTLLLAQKTECGMPVPIPRSRAVCMWLRSYGHFTSPTPSMRLAVFSIFSCARESTRLMSG